jgi:branched-chain amino acid transport system permease protein
MVCSAIAQRRERDMKPLRIIEICIVIALLLTPALGSKLTTFLLTDVIIWALFAVSLNLLVGYTGLVSFGHAAYFGVGAYACALLMKNLALPFGAAIVLAGVISAAVALVFGYFCVRLTRVYFSMLTLAFAQIAWATVFKANEVTGGDQGLTGIRYPDLSWLDALPVVSGWTASDRYHILVVLIVGISLIVLRRIVESPFGRMLTIIRENPERAEFVGVHVRGYQLAAFVIAGAFAGIAGGLFGVFNRGVFPDLMYWTKSAEVLIMVLLGGMSFFYGPVLGALALLWLNQEITAVTEYWSLIVGSVLVMVLFFLPGGIAGGFAWVADRLFKRQAAAADSPPQRGATRPATGASAQAESRELTS